MTERELTAEEKAAGSANPDRQSELILEESEVRKEHRDASPDTHLEKRTSDEATPPPLT